MTSQHDRHHDALSTSRDYEREAEHTRRRLADNLDELSDRLTPGQLFDEMLTYSRAGGGTFFRTFTNAMRENPLPSLLIGTGCMMFLSEKMGLRPGGWGNGGSKPTMPTAEPYRAYGGTSRGSDAAGRVSDAAGRVSDAAGRMTGSAAAAARSAPAAGPSGVSSAAEAASRQTSNAIGAVADTMRQTAATVGDSVAGVAEAVRGTTHEARDQASAASEQMRRGAQNVAGTVRDTAASMGGALADTASSMGGALADTAVRTLRQAEDAVKKSRDSAASFVTEQPLLCAAIGIAVGAALASLLPSTEAEDQLMGEAADAVKGAAGQVGAEALESAKNVTTKVADRAQSAVKEEGFSPSAVAEAARSVGEGMQQGAQGDGRQPGPGTRPQEGSRSAMSQPTAGSSTRPHEAPASREAGSDTRGSKLPENVKK